MYDNEYNFDELKPIVLLCGASAYFDHSSGIGYRCETCGCMVLSMGMPAECKQLYDMERVVDKLKGK